MSYMSDAQIWVDNNKLELMEKYIELVLSVEGFNKFALEQYEKSREH